MKTGTVITTNGKRRRFVFAGIGVLAITLLATGVFAEIAIEPGATRVLELTVGKSVVLTSSTPVKRLSLAGPEIADAVVITKRQVYVTGKAPGVTNLTVWEDESISGVIDLVVTPDIVRLKEKIHEIFPDQDVRISATHDGIVLSGSVSSGSVVDQLLVLAEPFAPGKVLNLLEVSGVHQVMLEVRVAEMSRSLQRRLGFNFAYISSSGQNLGLTLLNNLSELPTDGAYPEDPLNISDNVNAIFRFFGEDTSWTVFVDALKENGLLKILAEPTLLTLSGQSAHFLSGGEFPILVPQALGTVGIEYKAFGVGLSFAPTVLGSERIHLSVSPEVSELDFSTAVSTGGFVIPGLTTRRVSTVIELNDGQSFAIAGLLQENIREVVAKFPILGDIPVLGALFRSSDFQKNETELVVIVTPHLVQPLPPGQQPVPTDAYVEPNDFEFYLLGRSEGGIRTASAEDTAAQTLRAPPEGGLEGTFGHMLPE